MATASNKQALVFVENVTGQAWTAAPSHFGLWRTLTGTTASTDFYGGGSISGSPSIPGIGARVAFAVGGVRIRITGSGSSDTDLVEGEALGGIIDADLYVSLHSADPGTTGANEITRLAASRSTPRQKIDAGTTHANGWTVTTD